MDDEITKKFFLGLLNFLYTYYRIIYYSSKIIGPNECLTRFYNIRTRWLTDNRRTLHCTNVRTHHKFHHVFSKKSLFLINMRTLNDSDLIVKIWLTQSIRLGLNIELPHIKPVELYENQYAIIWKDKLKNSRKHWNYERLVLYVNQKGLKLQESNLSTSGSQVLTDLAHNRGENLNSKIGIYTLELHGITSEYILHTYFIKNTTLHPCAISEAKFSSKNQAGSGFVPRDHPAAAQHSMMKSEVGIPSDFG